MTAQRRRYLQDLKCGHYELHWDGCASTVTVAVPVGERETDAVSICFRAGKFTGVVPSTHLED